MDSRGVPIPGAVVQLVFAGTTDTTDVEGRFVLGAGNTGVGAPANRASWAIVGGAIEIPLEHATRVTVDISRVDGRRLWSCTGEFPAGVQRILMPARLLDPATGIVATTVRVGSDARTMIHATMGRAAHVRPEASATAPRPLTEIDDSVIVTRDGFARWSSSLSPEEDSIAIALTSIQERSWSMLGLPETRQESDVSSIFGEDSDYRLRGFSQVDRGDGTILDRVTGLLWQREESGSIGPAAASHLCSELILGGFDDWRLPDAHEAFSIQDLSRSYPSLDTSVFRWAGAEYWWSSSPGLEAAGRVWVTNSGGGLGAHDTLESVTNGGTRKMAARCVRSDGIATGSHRYTPLSDSIVRDDNTGLEWSRYAIGDTTWEAALSLAETAKMGGRDDWRLPDLRELQSLSDERLLAPSLDTGAFPDARTRTEAGTRPNQVVRLYWSSTALSNHPEKAWTVDFTSGLVSYSDRASPTLFVRPVRGGFGR